MNLIRRGDEVWLSNGRMEIHVLTILDNKCLQLEVIDPVMAKVLRVDVDENGYIILET